MMNSVSRPNEAREAAFTRRARPGWVAEANARVGRLDLPMLVKLTARSLIDAAMAAAGLSDFGDDEWREKLELVCLGLDREADLDFMGRVGPQTP